MEFIKKRIGIKTSMLMLGLSILVFIVFGLNVNVWSFKSQTDIYVKIGTVKLGKIVSGEVRKIQFMLKNSGEDILSDIPHPQVGTR